LNCLFVSYQVAAAVEKRLVFVEFINKAAKRKHVCRLVESIDKDVFWSYRRRDF
jgi:hypothetical protein